MALTWNISKCENAEELSSEDEWPITEAIIWGCMMIGIGEITKKNVAEWWTRYKIRDTIDGPFSRKGITLTDVVRRIGLDTNVFPKRSASEFMKNLVESVKKDYDHKLKQEREERDAKVQRDSGGGRSVSDKVPDARKG